MPRIFDGVAGNKPRLNRFDLSYTNTTSMSFGYLYPVQCDEVYPGDVFKLSCYCHAEVMPLVAPIMSDIQMFAHTFFVPYRIIYGVDNSDGKSIWEKFITGGEDGDYDTPLPAWVPDWTVTGFSSRTIWDSIGNPVEMQTSGAGTEEDPTVYTWTPLVPPSHVSGDIVHGSVYGGLDVSIAPKYSYNAIFNAFYRDENLVDEVDKDNEYLLQAAFKKDYFTSALERQQRGAAPALPVDISGLSYVKYTKDIGSSGVENTVAIKGDLGNLSADNVFSLPANYAFIQGDEYATNKPLYVDMADVTATTFTVSDLRLAFAIQRMQELSMRAGYRYTEWLSAHFNAYPTDARLDRPEYIGGAVLNVSVSPLTQNSETSTTPQGTKTGIGHVDSVQKIGNYRVLEHGLIMTVVSIRPKPIYQQGINRQWLRQSRFDYYCPEEAFLSEFGIYNAEVYVDGTSGRGNDDDIFGYQAAWNEMRCKNNLVTGAVREQFDYWTLARKFNTRPHLNEDFITIDADDFNKIFAVQDEDSFVVSWSNLIDAYRPIPSMGVPGLVDHVYGGM